jgi:outer membrane protein assembly factor BamB
MALEAATGKLLWERQQRVAPLTLTAARQRVFFHDGEKVVCLGAKSGDEVWTSVPLPRWSPMQVLFGPTLVAYEDVLLFGGGENMTALKGGRDSMTALSADTGKVLWTAEHPESGYASPEDVLVAGGLVWCGATTNRGSSGVFTGRDPRTGEIRSQFPPDDGDHMPHHRCHRAKATDRYILASRTGIEFVDFGSKHWISDHWVRGTCLYGIMPCNGLVYAPPQSCACYLVAKLSGFNALAPESPGRQVPEQVADEGRLERGPAYDRIRGPESAATDTDDWPTYHHDPARSGATKASVPSQLREQWQTELEGRLSSLVIAEGKVFVASVDTHSVHALDAGSGRELWRYTAGGRVDSPPTLYEGRVLFGSADGWVYCLRASDGELMWRFRAGPADGRLMAFEQLADVCHLTALRPV